MQMEHTGTAIIGGGIQGCALGARLMREGYRDFSIIDTQPLLAAWERGAVSQGLEQLRTPYGVHIDPSGDPESMLRFEHDLLRQGTAIEHGHCGGHSSRSHSSRSNFDGSRIDEPARADTFIRHSRHIVDRFELKDRFVGGWVSKIQRLDEGFITTYATSNGRQQVKSNKVVIAVGLGKPWMPFGGPGHHRVMHSDAVNIKHRRLRNKRICIVGGGLTAATLATHYAGQGNQVSLCSRSPITVGQLETSVDWRPGRQLHNGFLNTRDWGSRSRQLRAARVGSGITPAVWSRLTSLVDRGDIVVHEGTEVECWQVDTNDRVYLPDVEQSLDMAIFATGYRLRADDLPFLSEVLPDLQLTNGMPHLDNDFEVPNIYGMFMMGRLAELAGGPLSRNIPGAMYASEQIANRIS